MGVLIHERAYGSISRLHNLMSDVHSRAIRSYNMSRIRGRNTKPELMVRTFLHRNGYRFRLHGASLPGKPDIVLPKYKKLILVNGCFWHGHTKCKYFVVPRTRKVWWLTKISSNKLNDVKNRRRLRKLGWHVIVIWECQLRLAKREKTLHKLAETIG